MEIYIVMKYMSEHDECGKIIAVYTDESKAYERCIAENNKAVRSTYFEYETYKVEN